MGFNRIVYKKEYLDMRNCKQCRYVLTPFSRKYYCCDKQELVCSVCRQRPCKKCKKQRVFEFKMPQCSKCSNRLQEDEGFLDSKCGKHYCSRCLVGSFKYEYQKVINSKGNYPLGDELLVKLPCGDHCKFNDLLQFFKSYCIECGKQEKKTIDYELRDRTKLCYFCYNYFKDKYIKAFLKCLSCGTQIENYSKAGLADEQGMIICRQCVDQSQIEEIHMQKTKELKESKKLSQSVKVVQEIQKSPKQESKYKQKLFFNRAPQKQPIKQQKQKIFEQKLEPKDRKIVQGAQVKQKNVSERNEEIKEKRKDDIKEEKEKELKQERKQEKEQEKIQEKKQEAKQDKYEEVQKDKKQEIKQEKEEKINEEKEKESIKQQISSKQELPESSYLVTSSLQEEMQEGEEELRRSLGLKEKPMLKKHLSGETMVQHLQLQILANKVENFVSCTDCSIKILKKVAYNFMRPSFINKPSTFLSISSLEASFAMENSQKTQYMCRVCYSRSTKRKQSVLSKTLSSTRESLGQRQPKVSETQQTSNYPRVSDFVRKQDKGLSSSVNKGYGLQGVKPSIFEVNPRAQLPKRQQSIPVRANTPLKTQTQSTRLKLSNYTIGAFSGQKDLKRCTLCGDDKKRLILSFSRGYYCPDCYLTIYPATYARAARYIY